ncbi:MAG: hypothetical protein AB7F40_11525 [Victivallaceae bacterium]|nr:hypothetical protein [Victivallaceae bacterium]
MFSSKSRKKSVLSAKLYITDRTDRLSAEIKTNMFCMGGTERDIAELSESDILTFLKEIRENRRRQLEASGRDVDLIYYLWVEPFSFEALEADDDSREFILNVYTERICAR